MKIESLVRHEKWFDVPGFSGVKVLVLETTEADAAAYAEGLMVLGGGNAAKLGSDFVMQIRKDAIKDWQGITDGDGEPLPVTGSNKELVIMQDVIIDEKKKSMRSVLGEWMTEVGAEGKKLRADAEKN